MLPRTLPIALCLFLVSPLPAQDDGDFRPLFNGKDLDGWVVVNTAPSTWSFDAEGLLVCTGKPIGEIRTEKMYQNFILELEWRHLKPKGNAGVFVWADDITARGQPFHRGIEVQVLENAYGQSQGHTTHGDIFPIHGASMTPLNGRGGGRAFPTEERSKPSPEWNHYRIECRDGEISLAVNGKVVTRGKDCVPRKGYICLESEGGIVHYRNVRLRELPDTPILDPAHIAIAHRGYRSLYTGVDLAGWETATGWTSKDWILSSAAGAGALTTAETFTGDLGFVVDFKTTKDSGPARFTIRGATLTLDPSDPRLGPLLEEAGRWNRIEGSLIGTRLSLEVNGKPLENAGDLSGLVAAGPISLLPAGPVDWANLFVRPLPR
jgi:hypothetical protein